MLKQIIRRNNSCLNKNVIYIRPLSNGTTTTTSNENENNNKNQEENKSSGGIPWSLIIPVGIVGTIIAYFYRGSVNTKIKKKKQLELLADTFLDHEEIIDLRLDNNLQTDHYLELFKRCKDHFVSKKANPQEFFDYCANQLGGDFENGFRSKHLMERLIRSLKVDENNECDLDTLLVALSLTVGSDPLDLIHSIFNSFKQDPDSEYITGDTLVKLVKSFKETYQLPVRVLIQEINEYPYKRYEIADADYLIAKAAKAIKKDRKKAKVYKYLKLSDDETDEGGSEITISNVNKLLVDCKDFDDILLSNSICLLNECANYSIKDNKAAEDEKEKAEEE